MQQVQKCFLRIGLLVLVPAIHPPAAHGQTADTIQGCYLRYTGRLRIVTSPRECRRNEAPISWNTVGPQGPAGPAGPAGEPGTVAPPLVLTAGLSSAVISGINTDMFSSSSTGVHGQGVQGVLGEGYAVGVVGVGLRPGAGIGMSGRGAAGGVIGSALISGSFGGSFTSNGGAGFGVIGRSSAPSFAPGTGVSGVADDNITGPGFVAIGRGVTGAGYIGVWGRGRSTLTAPGGMPIPVQGSGVRGEGYYGIHGLSTTGYAGYFDGNVQVNGDLSATTLLQNSDRERKWNIAPVDGAALLHRLATLPVHTWSYLNEPAEVRHIGPMAQDFHAAFAVGADDRHIATVDEGGVALAAIQSLYEMSVEKDRRIDQLTSEIQRLREDLERLSGAGGERNTQRR